MPRLKVPARLEHLAETNKFLAHSVPAAFAGQLANVQLVCEELLVNVFSYAYPEGTTGDAEVDLQEVYFDGREMLAFTVRDWGKPFNPFATVETPDLTLSVEERPIGGLGVFLIRQLTVHQAYSYDGSSNWILVLFDKTASGASHS